jgi:hypothetical protein
MLAQRFVRIAFYQLPKVGVSSNECGRRFSPFVAEGIYRATLARLEHIRAQVNLRFLADMEQTEKRDAARYEQREYN